MSKPTHLPLKQALQSERLTPFGHALAGAMGAVVSSALVYPLDTVKTRIQGSQSQSSSSVSQASTSATATTKSAKKDTSNAILSVLLKTWQTEGLEGFFRGFSANMLGSFSMQFAYFFFHTTLRTSLLRRLNRKSLSTSLELLVGALAGALAQVFTIPVSVVATRQQLYEGPSKADGAGNGNGNGKERVRAPSMLQTAQEIIAESGVTGLWTGLKPGLVLTVNPAITYGVFERLKAGYLSTASAEARLTPGMNFLLGVGSKTLATVVTYPYIFAKVRLQAKQTSDEDETHVPTSNPTASTTTTTETPEGYPIFDPSSSHPQSFVQAAAQPPAHHSDTRPGEGDTFISSSDLEANTSGSPVPAAGHTDDQKVEKREGRLKQERRKKFTSAIEVLRYTYKVAGLRGWYQGMAAQILKAVLSQGILFTLKDQFERYALVLLILLRRLF